MVIGVGRDARAAAARLTRATRRAASAVSHGVGRLALAAAKLPGIDRIIAEANVRGATRRHLIEAAGLLWTARRIAGRVVNRYPDEPEWNDIGLRMEYVR